MKREEILFFLSNGHIRVRLLGSNKEYALDLDTSLFFEFGEISDVRKCRKAISEILGKMNFGLYYMKPNVIVLYNDICSCDIKFLYESALVEFNYNEIKFVSLSKLVRSIHDIENLVVADGDYYTLVDRGEKVRSIENLEYEPIIIGARDSVHIHYSDDEILWNKFKSCFTKGQTYDIIDVGDDEC